MSQRLDNEPDEAFAAFARFCGMRPRNKTVLAREREVSRQTIMVWAREFKWNERVPQAAQNSKAERSRKNRLSALSQVRRQSLKILKSKVDGLNAFQAGRLAVAAAVAERHETAAEQPAQAPGGTETEWDLTKLSLIQLRVLDALAAAASAEGREPSPSDRRLLAALDVLTELSPARS